MTIWVVGGAIGGAAVEKARESGSLTSFGMTGLLEIGKGKMEIGELDGAVEFDGGGVAEGVEDAEQQVGGDVDGVAVHDGGDAGARGECETGDLSVGEFFVGDDFDEF
jgi:hypothetical protein